MPVAAGKNIENTEKKSSPRKPGQKFSSMIETMRESGFRGVYINMIWHE
jgi:hypothetical protein